MNQVSTPLCWSDFCQRTEPSLPLSDVTCAPAESSVTRKTLPFATQACSSTIAAPPLLGNCQRREPSLALRASKVAWPLPLRTYTSPLLTWLMSSRPPENVWFHSGAPFVSSSAFSP